MVLAHTIAVLITFRTSLVESSRMLEMHESESITMTCLGASCTCTGDSATACCSFCAEAFGSQTSTSCNNSMQRNDGVSLSRLVPCTVAAS